MRFFGSIFFLVTSLFGAEAHLSRSSIVAGEQVVLILSAKGGTIKFPQITSIAGYKVVSTRTQQSLEYARGKRINRIEKYFTFAPLKSIDITPFEIEVDGKKESTKPLRVEVKKADATNSPFTLEMRVEKTDVMQFEAVHVEFIFKRDRNYDVAELRFTPPKLENFWIKDGKKEGAEYSDNFMVHKINIFIFPQKSGVFEITPAQINVGVINKQRSMHRMFVNKLEWRRVFSNSITLNVKKLEGANLHGSFDISLQVDTKNLEQNKGVNATLKIVGSGNFDDIVAYKLDIEGVNVFADKPQITSHATDQTIEGEFTQKFSISSSQDFTIPPLTVTYFDAKTQTLVSKQTEPIDIHVKNADIEEAVQLSPPQERLVESETSYIKLIAAFLVGILFTLLIVKTRKQELKLPKFKNNRDLLKEFLKLRGVSKEVDEQIRALEENIYANGKNKINKGVLKKYS